MADPRVDLFVGLTPYPVLALVGGTYQALALVGGTYWALALALVGDTDVLLVLQRV